LTGVLEVMVDTRGVQNEETPLTLLVEEEAMEQRALAVLCTPATDGTSIDTCRRTAPWDVIVGPVTPQKRTSPSVL
jgi:hypothetical protein